MTDEQLPENLTTRCQPFDISIEHSFGCTPAALHMAGLWRRRDTVRLGVSLLTRAATGVLDERLFIAINAKVALYGHLNNLMFSDANHTSYLVTIRKASDFNSRKGRKVLPQGWPQVTTAPML